MADLPDTLSEIFLREGLDDPNHVDTPGKFRLSAQAIEVVLAPAPAVIPGRASWREPGIHQAASSIAQWIPGSRFAHPGMTAAKSPLLLSPKVRARPRAGPTGCGAGSCRRP